MSFSTIFWVNSNTVAISLLSACQRWTWRAFRTWRCLIWPTLCWTSWPVITPTRWWIDGLGLSCPSVDWWRPSVCSAPPWLFSASAPSPVSHWRYSSSVVPWAFAPLIQPAIWVRGDEEGNVILRKNGRVEDNLKMNLKWNSLFVGKKFATVLTTFETD